MAEKISSFEDLRVYKLAFELQQEVFEASKLFPVRIPALVGHRDGMQLRLRRKACGLTREMLKDWPNARNHGGKAREVLLEGGW